MVSVDDSQSNPNINARINYNQARPYYYYTPPPSSATVTRSMGRSMRTIRSTIFDTDHSLPLFDKSPNLSENLTDSVIDLRLGELATKSSTDSKTHSDDTLDISRAFTDFSACSSDISGELQRLATLPDPTLSQASAADHNQEPCSGFLQRETFSTEIIESISPEDLQPTVKLCVYGLQSSSIAVKRSAAAKLRLLAKNRADNRALIGESGAVPALIPLLNCSDPTTQEHAVTALLNLSLHDGNKSVLIRAGAVKSLIYVLKTGTEASKQNAACALLSLALVDEYKLSIGACGAIPPLVALLINGSVRGKKDALTTLYKLCSVSLNKERAVSAGVVRPLVGLVVEQGSGLSEKAMVVLSSLAAIEIGQEAIIEEGGIAALVEAIEDGSSKGKEFAVLTLLQLCAESVRNRGFLVREGGIPPLVALSQNGTAKAKHKAERLLGYLREPRQEASSSSP
ncbi:U-box domain-containing protein 4-like [Salvia hispanica]|uniref:U-box domain-containing protein 4-like n=1 Tax=Salvia hispanica TaxID=49212 RepID=UPI002009D5BF|nr:U-box domain-containing protein 4-like [Salvia hispanica]XP_047953956.1 U-box domain-containing protein 4-like [Salvia hispanica]XP_047953957.1 U-box domain-containing protein 4-like [Salvia hispanica]